MADTKPEVKPTEDLIPVAVIKAICKAWPNEAAEILTKKFQDGGLGFMGDHYGMRRWGMYVGVEFDGYIHS